MYIIIKDIPTSLTIQALEKEVLYAIKWMLFKSSKDRINALKIIQLVDVKGIAVERFALVRVSSDNMKKRLIKSLNGRPMLNNRPYIVDAFTLRHWGNDRRTGNIGSAFNPVNNMRQYDRRRRGLNLVTYVEKVVNS